LSSPVPIGRIVPSEASISGKIDHLRGVKERGGPAIVGHPFRGASFTRRNHEGHEAFVGRGRLRLQAEGRHTF